MELKLSRPVPGSGSGPDLRLSRLCEVLPDRGINVSFYHGCAAPRGEIEGRVPLSAGVGVCCRREAHVSFVMRPVCWVDLWLPDVPSHRESSLTSHRGEAERKRRETLAPSVGADSGRPFIFSR